MLTWLRIASALSLAATGPLVMAQGRWVRARTPVLPGAAGPTTGQTPGTGAPASVLVIGESPVAGIGAPDHTVGLTGQLAATWAARMGRPVRWRVVGQNGATARITRAELLPRVPAAPVDLIVVVLGVNDTKDLVPAPVWQRELVALIAELRARVGGAPVVVSGVPPMARFPALPPVLREVLGLRARMMDAALRAALAGVPDATWCGGFDGIGPEMFCEDRFHPGPSGYAAWGAALAEAAPLLREQSIGAVSGS